MNLNLTVATRYGLNILGLLGVSFALYLGSSIFIPVTFSGLLAALLYPLTVSLHRRLRLPWVFCCFTTIFGLLALAVTVLTIIALSVPRMIERLPPNETAWQAKYSETVSALKKFSPFRLEGVVPDNAVDSNFYKSVRGLFTPEKVSETLSGLTVVGLRYTAELVLILFIVLFLLMEADMLTKKLRAIFGDASETQVRVTKAIGEIAEGVRTYLYWRTMVNFGLGVTLAVFYKHVAGLEQYILWGALTAMLCYVPYIGTIAAGVPPILEALLQGNPGMALLILVVYMVVVTFEGYIIVPWVMGRSMALNATTVMVACLYWHLVWGLAGLFLAMPLMAAIKSILLHVEEWKHLGDLLSSEDEVPPTPPPPPKVVDGMKFDGDATVVM